MGYDDGRGACESASLCNTQKRIGHVYGLRDAEGRYYIGSTINLRGRRTEHRFMCLQRSHTNPGVDAALKLHGTGYFTFEVLEQVDDVNRLSERENYYIQKIGHYNSRRACKRYGKQLYGMSQEARKHLSEALKYK